MITMYIQEPLWTMKIAGISLASGVPFIRVYNIYIYDYICTCT